MEFIKKNNQIVSIMKGIVIAILVTMIAITIFAILLVYTNLPEDIIKPVIITITGISLLIGSIIATRKLRKNGLINGALIGVMYILIIYLVSSIANSNFSLNIESLIMIVFGLIGGLIGRDYWN